MSNDSSKPTVNWGPVAAVAGTIGGFLLAQYVALMLLITAASWFGGRPASDYDAYIREPGYIFLGNLLIAGTLLALTYWFIKRRGSGLAAIGLGQPRLKHLAYAAVGYLVYFATYLLATEVIARRAPQWLEQNQDLGYDRASQGPVLALVFISLVVLPPLIEEILFRGFLFSGLRRGLTFAWATAITSLLFGAAHLLGGETSALLWISAVDTLLLSVVLCYLRERSGSLWPPILLHALKNGLAFAVLFIFRWG